MKKAWLILANGKTFEGIRYDNNETEPIGELVFNTGMTGYLESITDPSYYGQILIQTFPLIGNYGVIPEDFESDRIHMNAYIINKLCDLPSNFRSKGKLGDFLTEQGVPVLLLKDTRSLTKAVREHGVMNAMISHTSELTDEKLAKIKSYRINEAVKSVTSDKIKIHEPKVSRLRIVLMDFGTKANIIRELIKRNCTVITVPADSTSESIVSLKPDGIMLSNGPGDPAENIGIIEEIKKLIKTGIPIFGICLGHQLMALAEGAKTMKMGYGHRGANQPVMNLETRRVYITSQNHGYCVDIDTLPNNARTLFSNVNDATNEGVRYMDFPGFSSQFHPESCSGPLDMHTLFDDFVKLMEEVNINAQKS